MKLAYGILATVALGLVLFVLTNFWSSRVSSASSSSSSSGSSSEDNGDSWWNWVGPSSEDEATTEEGVVYSVMTYPLDVMRALYETYAT